SAPTRSWAMYTASEVTSSPVGGGGGPARVTTANLVTASGWSAILSASTVSPCRVAPIGAQIAASCPPSAASVAAAPLESASTTTASGRWWRSQVRHWAEASGCAITVRTDDRSTAVRAASTNSTGSTTSSTIISGS